MLIVNFIHTSEIFPPIIFCDWKAMKDARTKRIHREAYMEKQLAEEEVRRAYRERDGV